MSGKNSHTGNTMDNLSKPKTKAACIFGPDTQEECLPCGAGVREYTAGTCVLICAGKTAYQATVLEDTKENPENYISNPPNSPFLIETYKSYQNRIWTTIKDNFDALLKVINDGVYKNCSGKNMPKGTSVISCDELGRGLWFNEETGKVEAISSSIPTGCQQFVSSVLFSYKTDFGVDQPEYTSSVSNDRIWQAHPPGQLTFSTADYPYLKEAGRKICVKFDSNMGYILDYPDADVNPNSGNSFQTGLIVALDGNIIQGGGDGYFMNGDLQFEESGTANCICFETTGSDLTFDAWRYIRAVDLDTGGNPIDYSGVCAWVDTADITGTFFDGTEIS